MDKELPDLTGIRVACCTRNYKRAALLFDSITTVSIVGNSNDEIENVPEGIIAHDKSIITKVTNENDFVQRALKYLEGSEFSLGKFWEVSGDSALVECARLYRQQGATSAVLDLRYPEIISIGQTVNQGVGIVATLEQIPVAIETELSWEQVMEFKKDSESQRKYRDLHLWLEHSLAAKSEYHAKEIIEQKITDYSWAIRKHGIKTKAEIISSTLGLGSIIPTAGGLSSAAINLGPIYGVLTGVGLVITGISAWAVKRNIELNDIKRGANREIAYLYEIQKLIQ